MNTNTQVEMVYSFATLTRINFEAKLPEDFATLIELTDENDLSLCCTPFFQIPFVECNPKYITERNNYECFAIQPSEHKIVFAKRLSKWWLKRKWQLWKDKRNPKKYILRYINIETQYKTQSK